jgi:D-alanyl-D-alanine carboxypeptidase
MDGRKNGKYILVSVTEYRWLNTNKLLASGFDGIKTGHTDVAGPCLAASIVINSLPWIIIVLNCNSPERRFDDVMKISNWIRKREENRETTKQLREN